MALDSHTGQGVLADCCRELYVRDTPFNPNEEHMGSTTFGNVTPAILTGPAMPQDIKINRAGSGSVGSDGRA
jgi:hypothetical protein